MNLANASIVEINGKPVQRLCIDGRTVFVNGIHLHLTSSSDSVVVGEDLLVDFYCKDLIETDIDLYKVIDMTRTKLTTLTTDSEGKASYTYTGLGSGEVSFQAEYGDMKSNTVTIDDYTPTVTTVTCAVNNNNVSYGTSVTFTSTVKDQHNRNLQSGTVTFKNGSTTLGTGSISDGVATFTSSSLNAGSYSVTAEISSVTSSAVALTVNKVNTNLSIVPPTLVYTDAFSVTGALKAPDSSGTGLVGKTVTLTWNDGSDHTATTTTITGGAYSFSSTATTATTSYTFKVSYASDTNYNGSETSTVSVNLGKETSVLNVTSPVNNANVGSSFTASGSLLDNDNQPIAGAEVRIYRILVEPQVLLGTATTANDGSFSTSVSTSDLSDGNNRLLFVFVGGTYYTDGYAEVTVVKSSYDGISLSKTAGKQILSYADYSSSGNTEYCTVTAQLTESGSSASISGVTVTFNKVDSGGTVISQLGTAQTDSNGQASYTYVSVGAGDVLIRAEVGSLLTETFTVRDVHFYDSMTSDSGHWTYNSGVTKSYSSDGVSITASSDKNPVCDVALPTNFRVSLKAKSNTNNDMRYCVVGTWAITNGTYSSVNRLMIYNTWPPNYYINNSYTSPNVVEFEAEYNNGVLTVKKDGTTLMTQSLTLANQVLQLYTGANRTMTIKDIIVEEL